MSSSAITQKETSNCWPPAPVEKGVKWLRNHPKLTFALALIAITAIVVLFTLKMIPASQRFIIGSSTLGAVTLISLPIIFEWRRQNSEIERQVREMADAEALQTNPQREPWHTNRLVSFTRDEAQGISHHRALLMDALGGEEAFNLFPIIQNDDFQRRAIIGDLNIRPDEMTHSIMKGQVNRGGQQFDFIAIKFRRHNTSGEPYTTTIYQRVLYHGAATPVWQLTGEGGAQIYNSHHNLFQTWLRESRLYFLTNDDEDSRAALQALKKLIEGTHPRFELAE